MTIVLRRLAVVAAVMLLPILAAGSGWLAPLENHLSALRMAVHPIPPTGGIVIVDIDTKSINEIGSWPWPRRVYAELIDRLSALGGADIAIDVDLSASSSAEEDAILEAALVRAGGAIILPTFVQSVSAAKDVGLNYNRPIERFAKNSWVAVVNVRQDPDGLVRRFGGGLVINDEYLPSMPAMLAGGVAAIGRELPIDFSVDLNAIDRVSVVDVLRGSIDANRISEKKIIVGAQAVELRDFFNVPVAGIISGALLQAAAAETILQHRVLRETRPGVTIGGLIVIAFGVFAIGRLRWWLALSGILGASLLVEAAATFIQARFAITVVTAPWHLSLAILAIAMVVSELDLRRILQSLWQVRAINAQALLVQVVADSFSGVVVVSEDGIVQAASRTAAELLGQKRSLVGMAARAVLPSELAAAVDSIFAVSGFDRFVRRPHLISYQSPNGTKRTLEYVATISEVAKEPTQNHPAPAVQKVACLTFSDVTEQKAFQVRIERMAHFDALTELPNRNKLIERLEEVFTSPETAIRASAIVCFDLDGFKKINDTLGHYIGDQLLKSVAVRATALLPKGAVVARLGGDEFAAVFSGDAASEESLEFASALVASVGKPFHLDGHQVMVGASAGVAHADSRDKGPDDILTRADIALYRAKANGGNALAIFERRMLAAIVDRQRMEIDLWHALDRNEFEVWYQPQIDLRTNQITGFEALVRWRHPEHGLVSPTDFIPVAEAIGLIEPLGRWVLETACLEAASWASPARLAVNVSAAQFARADVAQIVLDALERSSLHPGRLDVEITESLFMQPSTSVQVVLRQLRSIGVGIALDDFGTGYSSLSYLHKFPITKIKLDRSFVSGLPSNAHSVSIVRAVAGLSKDLGLRLNAEGVENAAQIGFLTLLGIDEAQGFLFGRPQPGREIADLLKSSEEAQRLSA